MISVTDGKTIPRYQTRQTLFNIQPLKDVTMFDLEEIDLSAAPGTTNARKIRAGKEERCEDTCTRTEYAELEAVTAASVATDGPPNASRCLKVPLRRQDLRSSAAARRPASTREPQSEGQRAGPTSADALRGSPCCLLAAEISPVKLISARINSNLVAQD